MPRFKAKIKHILKKISPKQMMLDLNENSHEINLALTLYSFFLIIVYHFLTAMISMQAI